MSLIIPAIDIIEGRCVRLTQGDYGRLTVYDCQPAEMVRRMVGAGLGRIHAVDLTGARLGHPDALRTLEAMASVPGARIEWGGGLGCDTDVRDAFNAGASWAVTGSVAARQPLLFNHWLAMYGGEAMILGCDVRGGQVAVAGWTQQEQLTPDELMERFRPLGLGQVIVTDISRDGMLAGPDLDLYRRLQEAHPGIVFTVSGGISSAADIERADALGMPRVIVGKALYEGHVTLAQLSALNRPEPC